MMTFILEKLILKGKFRTFGPNRPAHLKTLDFRIYPLLRVRVRIQPRAATVR